MKYKNKIIFDHLESASVLVRDRSEAAELRLAHAREQLRCGRRSWPSPRIETIESALRRRFDAVVEHEGLALRVLPAHEDWMLWRRATSALIAESQTEDALPLDTDMLAESLWRAARLATDWGLEPGDAASAATESRWLAQVVAEVDQAATELNAIARHRLPRWLATRASGRLGAEPDVWRLVSLPTEVEAALRGGDHPASPSLPGTDAATPQVRVALDTEQEFRLAAEWSRERLLANPEVRLKVIIPTLAAVHEPVTRIFTEVLTPSQRFTPGSHTAFQVHSPKSLRQAPRIRAALDTIGVLLADRVDGDQLAAWWNESFWGRSSLAWRAEVSRHFRTRPLDELSRHRWREQVQRLLIGEDQSSAADCVARLQRADQHLTQSLTPAEQAPGKWAQTFSEVLQIIGWPSLESAADLESSLDLQSSAEDDEPAVLDAWQALLEDFAETETVLGRCSAKTALHMLGSLAGRQMLSPALRDVGVHITASLESVVGFDGIWVCGLRAEDWPEPPRVNGFLAFSVMRAAGIPEVDAAGQFAKAEKQLASWRESTGDLVLSWAVTEQESVYLPSPLLQPWLPEVTKQEDDGRHWLDVVEPTRHSLAHILWQQRIEPERYTDQRGLPWPEGEKLRGGVWAVVDQHQCPFSAYARRRLRTGDPEQPALGIDARLRGQLLHRAFELIWRKLGNRARLVAATPQERQKIIDDAVRQVDFRALDTRISQSLGSRLSARERDRLAKLAHEALALEQTRSQDFTVLLDEESLSVTLGAARIEMRVDRVDQLADGSWLVIDYKTGTARMPKWSGEDFDAIQLWLYAEALRSQMSGPLAGLAHFSLRTDKVGFLALARSDEVLDGAIVSEDLDALQSEARSRLYALASDFLAGEAQVAPRAGACKTCELPLLCRKAEWLDTETDR